MAEALFQLTPKQKEAVKLTTGPERHILLEGGARSAKTFTFVRNIMLRALKAKNSRHVILRLNSNACHQSVRLDTHAKVMRLCFPEVKFDQHIQDGYDTYPNGSEVWFAGLDDKERVDKILGKEFSTVFFNECSQIPYTSVLTALTRLAQKVPGLKNKAYYDQNPTGTKHWTQRLFKDKIDPISRLALAHPENYAWMRMNPVDNVANIDEEFLAAMEAMPERYRKRFLLGVPMSELDGALWPPEMIEERRLPESARLTDYDRIIVAIDPSGAKGEDDERSDEIGISVVGKRKDYAHVLADATMKGSPEQWGREAIRMYRNWKADAIVGEKNFGGDMVRSTIHAIDNNVRFLPVTATRGKVVRAEPVSALFETKHMFFVGNFPKLEDELLNFTTNGYKGDRSPNRADAMIWAAHELMLAENDQALLIFIEEWGRAMGLNPTEQQKKIVVPAGSTLQ
jgi:phage terminase large subunit-like protein